MRQEFVYPAVLYYDEENNNYAVAFNDLDIFTEGETVEDAFKSAKEFLLAYLECAHHIESEIEQPTSSIVVKDQHKADIVLLVDSSLDTEAPKGEFVSDITDFDLFEEE
ncbi:MAG: type II toxin-antitoxin system HicB family antitoxin [Christensenellales bacterium]